MQEKNSVIHLDIAKHALCYLISFGGLYLFLIIFMAIFSLFPSFRTLNTATQNTILQTIAYGLTFTTIIIYLRNIVLKEILKQFKNFNNVINGFLYGSGLIIGTILISTIFSLIGTKLGAPVVPNENEQAIMEATFAQPVLTALMTVIFAPVTEEIGYRLGIFGGVHKYNRFAAYAASSIIFALIHTNFAEANFVNELLNVPSYLFAGIWLCFTYERSGSIVTSITAHMTNNAVVLILSLTNGL
ncbi:MAG: CPBP family intramembrane metalloprotease [Erysipelotrichales bacterium]|nr:CPBP family intramembrane metalloprotease [Erysipelotrichales bacterium]